MASMGRYLLSRYGSEGKFTKAIGSALIVGTAYHKNTSAKVECTNCVLGCVLLTEYEQARSRREAARRRRRGQQ